MSECHLRRIRVFVLLLFSAKDDSRFVMKVLTCFVVDWISFDNILSHRFDDDTPNNSYVTAETRSVNEDASAECNFESDHLEKKLIKFGTKQTLQMPLQSYKCCCTFHARHQSARVEFTREYVVEGWLHNFFLVHPNFSIATIWLPTTAICDHLNRWRFPLSNCPLFSSVNSRARISVKTYVFLVMRTATAISQKGITVHDGRQMEINNQNICAWFNQTTAAVFALSQAMDTQTMIICCV